MGQKQQVILSIKRSVDTVEGQILNYLQTEPFGLGSLPEIVMLVVKQYWLPFASSAQGVDGEELRQRAIWAIGQLEAQANLIRGVFLESQVVVNKAQQSNSAEGSKLEEDSGLVEIEMPSSITLIEEDSSQEVETEVGDENLELLNIKSTEDLEIATKFLAFE